MAVPVAPGQETGMSAQVLIDGRPAQGRARGIGTYVARLLPELSALDERPGLAVALDRCAGPDPWPDLLSVPRVWGDARQTVHWEQVVLPALAAEHGADLLHCTANTAPWRSKVPYLVTVHDAIFLRPWRQAMDRFAWKGLIAHLYYRHGIRQGARRAKLVLTDSEASRAALLPVLGLAPDRILRIPLAEPYPPAAVDEQALAAVLKRLGVRQPYVLGLGAVDPRKNTANLVRACARLSDSLSRQLVLAGFELSRRSRVPQLIRELRMESRVKLLGYLPSADLQALFQGAAVFAYPTLAEGFGLPVLQAFHLGVPVVTSNLPALRELAGNAVAYADPADPRSISRALAEVLTEPEHAHQMAFDAFARAREFTWTRTAQATAAAYQRALASAPQTRS